MSAGPAERQHAPQGPVLPTGEWCQRWSGGTHSWRHVSEGGFNQHHYSVEPIPEAWAKAFVLARHYTGSFPAARLSYGLWAHESSGLDLPDGPEAPRLLDGRQLVGVAVLSVPMQEKVLTGVFPGLAPYEESLELGRFVLADEVPANGESWMISRVFRHAAEEGLRGVVSFSDPMPRHRQAVEVDESTGEEVVTTQTITPGHVGQIYAAANGYACGRSAPRSLVYVPSRGVVLTARTLSKIRNQERGAGYAERTLVGLGARPRRAGMNPRLWLAEALNDLRATRVQHPGNFRYAWALGPQKNSVVIAMPRTPYPKRDRDLAASPFEIAEGCWQTRGGIKVWVGPRPGDSIESEEYASGAEAVNAQVELHEHRRAEVARLTGLGRSAPQIAEELGINQRTVTRLRREARLAAEEAAAAAGDTGGKSRSSVLAAEPQARGGTPPEDVMEARALERGVAR